uniref:Uncharacterized protein n=1 Tax=Mycobacterium riyadhense TaxID=486698 RepID=A0A653F2R8_9MYCO|nr:hypothetical protein BIN_B_05052 [Mycobacterium riyadhense]
MDRFWSTNFAKTNVLRSENWQLQRARRVTVTG